MPGILNLDTPWDDLEGGPGSGNGSGSGGSHPSNYADAVVPETGTLQILLGLGRMEGLVNGLKSIYFDKTPLQNSDGSFNFKGVSLALVAGTNTQPAVKGIGGTESETLVDVQVTQAAPVVRSISSNPSAVRVRISIPALKVISSTTGQSSGHSVEIKIERQNASYNGGAWETVVSGADGVISGGPFSTKFTKAFRIDTPATGTWQIKVSRVSADDADVWHLSQTKWDAYTEIVDAKFRLPNMSVLSCRVNAKQFRSIPQITCHMKGRQIQVPANYTPASYNWATKTWTGAVYRTTGLGTSAGAWDGTFTTLYSSNPAWVFYDACTSKLAGAGAFLSAGKIDKWALYQIAQWCDACETGTYVGVSDGHGGLEPRMTCNLYLQGQQNAIKALSDLASIFSGILYYAAGQVVAVADTDSAPVALFTNANVEEGKFQYQGTALQARHTSAIVRFQNPELGYELDSAIYDPAMDPATLAVLGYDPVARYGRNILDLQGIGCNSPGQALRMAKHAVLSELLAPEIVGFTTGLEGSHRRPSEVVQVADQFRAGNTRSGGRVVSATTTSVTLDAPVTLGAGTYILRCQTGAGMESKTVTTGAGTTSTLAVSGAFSSAPAAGAGWLLQAGSAASLWRILSVKKADGLKYEINALKHDPAKYVALGLTAGDVVPRPPVSTSSPSPVGLAVTSVTRILNDRQQLTLTASWTLDAALGYIAQASRDYGPWEDMAVSGASAYLDGIQPGIWRVRVAGDWRAGGLSPYATASATVTASSTIPTWTQQALDATAALGSDGILSVGEKPAAVTNYTGLSGQVTALRAQATAIGATLPTANTLLTYLTGLGPYAWDDVATGHDTVIPTPATWTSKWNEIYGEVSALTSNIAAKLNAGVGAAAASATWGGITGASAQASPSGGWTGTTSFSGGIRQTGADIVRFENTFLGVPAGSAGIGVEVGVNGGSVGRVASVNRTVVGMAPLEFEGSSFNFKTGSATFASSVSMGALTASSTTFGNGVSIGDGGAGNLTIGTNSGWLKVGPLNATYCHFDTNAASGFYFYQAATFASSVSMGALTASGVSVVSPTQSSVHFKSAVAGPGFIIGRSLGSADTNDFFIYDVTAPATRFTISSTGAASFQGNSVSMGALTAKSAGSGTYAIQVKDSTGGHNLATLYDAAGAGVLELRDSSGTAKINANGSDGSATFAGTVNFGNSYTSFGTASDNRYLWRSSNSLMWRYNGTNDGELLHTGNVGTNAATLQAAVASATAPKVGTYAQMIAWTAAAGTTPYWYATDQTDSDGLYGKLYQWNGSSWVAVGTPQTVVGRVVAGVISAGAVGAQAIAADVALVGQVIRNTGYSAGTSTAAPSGFKLAAGGYTATCWNGDSTGAYATTNTVQAEFGTGVSIAGYDVSTLALGRLVNGGTKTFTAGQSGNWKCPPGITIVEAVVVGAGGGGGKGTAGTYTPGGGGGGTLRTKIQVTPGTLYAYSVGTGGAGATTAGGSGSDGGNTTFSTVAAGGGGGAVTTGSVAGQGGSVTGQSVSIGNSTIATTPGVTVMDITICGGAPGSASGGTGLSAGLIVGGAFDGAASGGGASLYARGGSGNSAGTPTQPGYGGGGGATRTGGAGGQGGHGVLILQW